ncbi:MAG: hypothetical protein R8M11_03055 [Gallionella sp.]
MNHIIRLILLAFALLLAGCVAVQQKELDPFDGPLIWPQPPEQPRFAYEAVLHSSANIADISEERSLQAKFTNSQAVSDQPLMGKPGAIAARNGRIYVADTKLNNIVVFDIPRRKVFYMGIRKPGNLANPAGIALDVDMNVYVADSKRRMVFVYDSLGYLNRTLGGPDVFERPTGVAVSPDVQRIYVVDRSFNESDQHRVVVLDWWGQVIQIIGSRGSEDGEFNIPLKAAVAPDGTLYVLDSGNFRIQVFDKDGKFLRKFGNLSKSFGSFVRPRGIAIDDDGLVYVTDSSFNNIQIFNPEGQLLLAIGEGALKSNPGQYGMLNGVAVDETGRIYVVDQFFNKVEVIRSLSDSEGKKMLEEASKELDESS